ncbi:Fe-S cluster assembly protein SufD [Conexibacter woesei]|uniref:FeS assembly protein SufD n=1 Tax=Conexibacter woesei (strain DSM 14684 / CCUG 47730 / CIP 108061 / JCM 11494 / NBRC 100937 / ID131577) TaxID=469383 RepID=D3FFK5_CONWI|nr:Fe-S cluster assembly protein SufD [Conexibacter woesei]ADB53798.1 FeS assembly protein SufD [Conexibacter woesei DSM 14684]
MASATIEQPSWLAERRARAAGLTERLDLPTYKGRPGWEFTDISSLDLAAYAAAGDGDAGAVARADALFVGLEQPIVVTQVDATTVEVSGELPEGVVVTTLERAAAEHPELVERHLGTIVAGEDAFVARNEAGFAGGLFVHVPRGTIVPRPVLVTVVQDADRTALNWRSLIVVEDGGQAEVWEQYLSADAERETLLNTVVELVVGENANLRFVNGQNLSEKSWIFGTQRSEVGRDGALDWVSLGFGSARGKVRMETKLAGKGADGRVTGAYASHKRQHVDFDTTQEHAAPHTTSDLAFRGVLQGRSEAVWRGNIIVDPGAQQTDAFQESRNLLLSKRAHADAIPGLEIQANDVRCTHAAAIAQIDPEQLFYLKSRGLRPDVAKRLVIEGFLAELVERFEEGPVRQVLGDALERRLGLILGD